MDAEAANGLAAAPIDIAVTSEEPRYVATVESRPVLASHEASLATGASSEPTPAPDVAPRPGAGNSAKPDGVLGEVIVASSKINRSRITVGALWASDEHSLAQVSRLARLERSTLMHCYQDVRGRDSEFRGELEVSFLIVSLGHTKAVRIVRSTIGDPRVEDCVANTVRGWRFPERDDHDTEVTLPLHFDMRPDVAYTPPSAGRTPTSQ